MNKKNIFITGATGLLGAHISKWFLEKADSYRLILLVRKKNNIDAEKRGIEALKKVGVKDSEHFKRVTIISGEIEKDNFSISEKEYKWLTEEVDSIFHCSAITSFQSSIDECRRINLTGTLNILHLASSCKKNVLVGHVSTSFVLGKKNGILKEKVISKLDWEFNNPYEQSKYEAELLISNYREKNFSVIIFRPSIIIGDSQAGKIWNFKLFYEAIRLFSSEVLDVFPGDRLTEHNFIPVDIAAEIICNLACKDEAGKVFHVVSPNNLNCYKMLRKASGFFKYKNPKWISLKEYKESRLSFVQKRIIDPFVPYFNYFGKYDSRKTFEALKKRNISLPKVDEILLEKMFLYCRESGYIKK